MIKINESDYAYASARVRALETKLFDSGRYDRMIDAPHAEEAFKVLSEAEYGKSGGSENVFAFESLLDEEMKRCYSLLLDITPQPEIIKAFQRKHDFFNIKVLLKAEFSDQEAPDILMNTGTIDREHMKRIIREREYGELTPVMQRAIVDTHDAFTKTRDPQIVDLILDKASFAQLVSDLGEIDNDFLQDLSKIIVDVTNIKMFIRSRLIKKAWDFLEKLLLEGGTLSIKTFFDYADKSLDAFVEENRFGRYGDVIHDGWALFKANRNLSGLEKQLDNFLMEYIKRARVMTMGAEPLIAYLYAKEAEIRNIRIIMTGRINRLPADVIRERLRLGYV